MRKLILAILVLFVLIGCSKQPTTSDDLQYPFVDEDGRLNVDVSDYEFE